MKLAITATIALLVSLLFFGVMWMMGNGPAPTAPGASPAETQPRLEPGTRVSLRLLKPLSSSDAEPGDRVDWVVGSPVVISGQTLVPAGAHATGVVVRARSGSLGGALVNQPPRLVVRLEVLNAGPGQELVPIRFADGENVAEEDGDRVREFRRGENNPTDPALADALRNPDVRAGAQRIAEAIAAGEELNLEDPGLRTAWQALVGGNDLGELRQWSEGKPRLDFGALKAQAAAGRLPLDDALGAMGLVQALSLASGVVQGVGRALTTPQINVPAGLMVEAEVAPPVGRTRSSG